MDWLTAGKTKMKTKKVNRKTGLKSIRLNFSFMSAYTPLIGIEWRCYLWLRELSCIATQNANGLQEIESEIS